MCPPNFLRMAERIFSANVCSCRDRNLVYSAALEMNPIDKEQRAGSLKRDHGIGYCNITKCCTKVCPEGITITDNAIIPLKERVVDRFFDPLSKLFRVFSNSKK